MSMATVLLVDDEPAVLFTLEEVLDERGYRVVSATSGQEALTKIAGIDVVVTDLAMPGMDGMALLAALRAREPELPVILLTARGSERLAVQAMKAGAWDYLCKPFDIDEVELVVKRAAETRQLRAREHRRAAERALGQPVIGESPALQSVLDAIARVADRDVTVLVRGETGTGKELLASLLHAQSRRAARPLVRFNCAAIADSLAESELFGHAKGAFTGARAAHAGYFSRANGGTLVLDEVGELSLAIQAKLLRVIQEGEIQPVGAGRVESVDVRVVSCTNRDLLEEVKQGRFRDDLYYRLAVVEIAAPPLRDRREDIAALAEAFRRRYARRFDLDDIPLPAALLEAFGRYHWPGNVRELENTIARLLALSTTGAIDSRAWQPPASDAGQSAPPVASPAAGAQPATMKLRERVRGYERQLLAEALARANGNQSEAARQLGITRTTLIDKLKRYGLFGR